jgi:hypothetical protein
MTKRKKTTMRKKTPWSQAMPLRERQQQQILFLGREAGRQKRRRHRPQSPGAPMQQQKTKKRMMTMMKLRSRNRCRPHRRS